MAPARCGAVHWHGKASTDTIYGSEIHFSGSKHTTGPGAAILQRESKSYAGLCENMTGESLRKLGKLQRHQFSSVLHERPTDI